MIAETRFIKEFFFYLREHQTDRPRTTDDKKYSLN